MKNRRIRIISDETIDFVPGLEENDLALANVHLFLNGKEVIFSREKFYKMIKDRKNSFNTSQANPEDFIKVMKKFPDDDLIVLTVTSKLSGTYNSALVAKGSVKNRGRIEVVDSLSLSAGLGILALRAKELISEDKIFDEIINELNIFKHKIRIFLVLKTLDYLVAGGRVNRAIGFVAKIVNLKPVLEIRDGNLVVAGKMLLFDNLVRGFYDFTEKRAKSDKIFVLNNSMKDECSELKKLFESKGLEVMELGSLNPALGVHAGPECLAAGWISE